MSDILLHPNRAGTPGEKIKMAQDCSPIILVIGKLRQKHMECRTERIKGEVTQVFCKRKDGECDAER